jgi:formylglycine-generating enzyme required for sulfatase activity/energy-coupling factor transporter ATP-binding protein EcfA2
LDPVAIGIIIGIVGLIIAGFQAYYAWKNHALKKKEEPSATPDKARAAPADMEHIGSWVAVEAQPIALEPDFDDSKYREWLSDEAGFIDIRGIRVGTAQPGAAMRFPILELYTELNVQKGLTNWDLDQGNLTAGQRISLTMMLESTGCVAIVGDPGSGKTTFLRYVARKQIHQNSDVLPVYIDLPDFYKFAIKETKAPVQDQELESFIQIEADHVMQYLLELGKKENLAFNINGLRKRTNEGKFIFLFDSLDELPSDASRELLVDALSKIVRRWNKCKFVIASRPLALSGKAIPVGFEVVGIDPLQNEEIKTFLNRWSLQLFPGETQQKKFYTELYSNIIESQQLRSLARNPVMLTCMAVLHYNNRHLPAGRADLLEAVIQWFISAKEPSSRPVRETPEFIAARYAELALMMFGLESGPKNRVGRQWAANAISRHFANDESQALDFLGREENLTGLLVRRGEGDLSFWHSSFLEYLAAKEIAGRTDDEQTGWWSKIRSHLDDPQWREVLALVPCCLNRLGSNRVDLFFERVSHTCDGKDLKSKIKTVGFAGRILRDLLIVGYDPVQVSSWNRLLGDIEPIFQDSLKDIALEDRYEAAVAYGLAGDKRLRNFEDAWISIPNGVLLMGAQRDNPAMSNYDEFANPWEGPVTEIQPSSFEVRRYPTTIHEYESFIRAGGYHNGTLWCQEGWKWRVDNKISSPANWDNQLLYPNCPVTSVSWYEANAYCRWLSVTKAMAGCVCRLPSEAEWEYVARRRIPESERFPWGNAMTEGDAAESNWGGCNLRKKSPVGMFPRSNTTDGVADMFGNIEEWCGDCWTLSHSDYPQNGRARDIAGELRKVVRGGSTIRYMRLCRPTYRSKTYAYQRYQTIGFRVVRVPITV